MLSTLNNSLSYDEFSLFTRVTWGDETAFREVVHHYSPKLLSFLYSITKTTYTAEEIMQEVFLRLWQKREVIEVDNLGRWLHRVAANLAYSYLKREALKGRLLDSLKNKPVERLTEIDLQMDYKESEALIYKALSQLPDQQRKVYQLSLQEGLSRKEIADLLNISPHTVKNHQAKALQSIKNFLGRATVLLNLLF